MRRPGYSLYEAWRIITTETIPVILVALRAAPVILLEFQMEGIRTYKRGNAVTLIWATFDGRHIKPSDYPIDPDSVAITLYDPDGAVVFENEAMTKVSQGYYWYSWQIPVNADTGEYIQEVTTVAGAYENTKRETAFIVTTV